MPPPVLRLVLGDQLSPTLSSLRDAVPSRDIVVMAEVMEECTYTPHHKQKIALVLSAMRHFAQELRGLGLQVDYTTLKPDAPQGFVAVLRDAIARHKPQRVAVTEPGEWRLLHAMGTWEEQLGIPVEVRSDSRFLCSRESFAGWVEGRKDLRMEWFYRGMRRTYGLLMESSGTPIGGTWNLDKQNRKPLPRGLTPPEPLRFAPDSVTQEVLALVARTFPQHPGKLESFAWPVTRAQAEEAAEAFMVHALPHFGDVQDAMASDQPFLFHSLLAPALNMGLLEPLALCHRAAQAFHDGHAPLNAVEGFIRQIIGWREFIRGIYWTYMPFYEQSNALDANRPIPAFYWTGETVMHCVAITVRDTMRYAYAHHIQRLMVTGLFALLAGIRPRDVNLWYMAVYADAYAWVQLPNTHGMALYADGGIVGSKPYAASGKYINRMSDYCQSCRYDPNKTEGEDACPFNLLYWDFLARHRDQLKGNNRMRPAIRNMERMPPARLTTIRNQAKAFLEDLKPWEGPPGA